MIEAALAHATGRPRPLPVRAVLTALLCLAIDDRPLFLTEATGLLFGELSGASRALLGVPGTISGDRAFLAAYRRVRYCFHRICDIVGVPRRCPTAGAWPPATSGPASRRCSRARPRRPETGWKLWSTR